MIHAFLLVVILGSGDTAKQQPNPMYFRSIDVCQFYAKRIFELSAIRAQDYSLLQTSLCKRRRLYI